MKQHKLLQGSLEEPCVKVGVFGFLTHPTEIRLESKECLKSLPLSLSLYCIISWVSFAPIYKFTN